MHNITRVGSSILPCAAVAIRGGGYWRVSSTVARTVGLTVGLTVDMTVVHA
jgi:hypothetical protein